MAKPLNTASHLTSEGGDNAQRTIVLVLDGDIDALLRALNTLHVARARCVSIDYDARGAEALAVVDVLHEPGPALHSVVNKIAAMHGVHEVKLLANAEPDKAQLERSRRTSAL